MSRIRLLLLACICIGTLYPLAADETEQPPILKERPRVFLGPYNDLALDHYYYGYPRIGYYSPFFSPLGFYEPMIPGRSTVSFAVGSDGYRGASFSTTQAIKGTNVLFSLSSRWEEGDAWYLPGYHYSQHLISPRFSWSNENTFISVGVDVGEYQFSKKEQGRLEQPRVNRGVESPLVVKEHDFSYETEIESVNLALSHRLGNLGELLFTVSKDDYGNDSLSTGIRRTLYQSRKGRGEWYPGRR